MEIILSDIDLEKSIEVRVRVICITKEDSLDYSVRMPGVMGGDLSQEGLGTPGLDYILIAQT